MLIVYVACANDPAPLVFEHPIDIVYLWVDGNDPEWLAVKNSYLPRNSDAYTANRFNDNEELRYSLRSLLQFAPFINHIYIVTMNQRPHWLAEHPKITIVDHTEIFKDPSNLPTFNSHALESNLHRIPGLSEYFIYFNDDVFLGAPVSLYDFFTEDGCIKVLFEQALAPSGLPLENETTYRRAWRNSNAFLDAKFKNEERYRLCHAPFAMRKSCVEAVEGEHPEIFASNSSHRFRSNDDYNIMNGFLQYYLSYHTKVERGSLSNMMVSFRGDDTLERTKFRIRKLKKNKPHTFCLQDVMGDTSTETRKLLRDFLNEYYPEAAPWEKNL